MMMMMKMKTGPVRSVCVIPGSVWDNLFSAGSCFVERWLTVFGNICMRYRCAVTRSAGSIFRKEEKKKLNRVKTVTEYD